ncbi:MAG: hypothetical protein WCK07_11190 [Betaproteobacteria bacterium]
MKNYVDADPFVCSTNAAVESFQILLDMWHLESIQNEEMRSGLEPASSLLWKKEERGLFLFFAVSHAKHTVPAPTRPLFDNGPQCKAGQAGINWNEKN